MRHRANRASTPYCQSEAKSHAGILGNVANAGMLPMSNPNVSGIAAKMAAFPVRRNRNGQDAPLSNGTECGTMSPFPEGEKEMRTMSKTIERPRLDEDVVPFTEYRRTLNDCFARTARTHRPIVITQNGRSTSVMMSVADFESTWDEIEAMRKRSYLNQLVEKSRQDFANDDAVDEDELFDSLEKEINESVLP